MEFLEFCFEGPAHFFGILSMIIILGIFVDNVITNITNMISVIFNSFKRDYKVIHYNFPNVTEIKGNIGENKSVTDLANITEKSEK
jgi:cellulose synthase/poly-beta-1,6-N-acetylglucosamine synthase-like glycosyltransferase